MENQETSENAAGGSVANADLLGKWTDSKPRGLGFYWLRFRTEYGFKRPQVIQVVKHYGSKRLMFTHGVKPIYIDDVDGQFSGPIPFPIESDSERR